MEEIETLEKLQRIAKCETLDNLIDDAMAKKSKQKKGMADTSKHLRQLRKRKACAMLKLAGMTKQKLEDMNAGFAAKEARREARKRQKNEPEQPRSKAKKPPVPLVSAPANAKPDPKAESIAVDSAIDEAVQGG